MTSIVSMRLKSASPLLMHNPAGSMSRPEDQSARVGKVIPTAAVEAAGGLYRLPDGQLYIPTDAFREAALIAATEVRDPSRKGRTTMTKRFSYSVFLCNEAAPLFKPKADGELGARLTDAADDWEVHVKRVVIQKAGIMRARALVREWIADLQFEYDERTIDEALIAAIVEQAGRFPGVLDYRPGKKGPFGRYQLVRAG